MIASSAAAMSAARPQSPPPSPSLDLGADARDQLRKNAEALNKTDLPMSTEPAFSFKA